MARSQEPLLAPDRENDGDSISQAEEDALLTGERVGRAESKRRPLWLDIGLAAWATVATIAVIILAVLLQRNVSDAETPAKPEGKRNLIFMVSDGMGPTSLALTRSYKQYVGGLPWSSQLVLDTHLIGQSRTRSSSSLVTDSAAGATAFSCGEKSYNGAISILPDHSPCGTVLEAAKKAGYKTGLVVTTRITDATPATFAAHVNMRSEEDSIAEQLIGNGPLGHLVDIMLGGGRCHFQGNGTDGGCRADDQDIIKLAKKNGYNYAGNRKDFDDLKLGDAVKLPLLGLFAETDIPFEIDRRNQNDIYPSLDEMAKTAIKALSEATKDSDKGFFLMIEGSRIDHAGHANDPAAQVHEVLAYDDAVSTVLEFLKDDATPGVMVSTSDHETGGLSTARQLHESYPEYLWYPDVLANASASAEFLAADFWTHHRDHPKDDVREYAGKLIRESLQISDISDAELDLFAEHIERAAYYFADIVSRRAQTGWATHGHSGADVNIYSSSPHYASPLIGNHENTEVGKFLASFLEVDVAAITKELKAKAGSWNVGVVPSDAKMHAELHQDHYDHDFKKSKRDCGCI